MNTRTLALALCTCVVSVTTQADELPAQIILNRFSDSLTSDFHETTDGPPNPTWAMDNRHISGYVNYSGLFGGSARNDFIAPFFGAFNYWNQYTWTNAFSGFLIRKEPSGSIQQEAIGAPILEWLHYSSTISTPHQTNSFSGQQYESWRDFSRTADTTLLLYTGGDLGAPSSDECHFRIGVTASEIADQFYMGLNNAPTIGSVPYSQITLMGKTPDPSGVIYTTMPENIYMDATPSVSGVPNYVFAVNPEKYKITLTYNGENANNRTYTELVGKRIGLSVGVSPAITPAPKYFWTVEGSAVQDFYVSPAPTWTNGYPVPISSYTNSSISFTWPKAGTYSVTCKVTVDGMDYTRKATFTMTEPVYSERGLAPGEITLTASDLRFGSGGTPGVALGGEPQPATPGQMNYVNVINTTTERFLDGTGWKKLSATNVLDSTFPYGAASVTNALGVVLLWFADAPGDTLAGRSAIEMSDSFSTYLIFRPSSGDIWVPLVKWDWSWQAKATNSAGTWMFVPSSTSRPPRTLPGSRNPGFPSWTNNIKLYGPVAD